MGVVLLVCQESLPRRWTSLQSRDFGHLHTCLATLILNCEVASYRTGGESCLCVRLFMLKPPVRFSQLKSLFQLHLLNHIIPTQTKLIQCQSFVEIKKYFEYTCVMYVLWMKFTKHSSVICFVNCITVFINCVSHQTQFYIH